MNELIETARPPLGIRVLNALGGDPDLSTITFEELAALQAAVNKKRSSRVARLITGFPDRSVDIRWHEGELPDRALRVRVYRPSREPAGSTGSLSDLPLVLHVHGGGFVGTAAQCDWSNSYFAAQVPAVVVSVEHRLLSHHTALSAAVDDGWDALRHVAANHADWGIDPDRVAVVGESTGALIVALAAIRAREAGRTLRGQVLVNPAVDLTPAGLEYASMHRHADSPTLTRQQMQLLLRFAIPPGMDPRELSPVYTDDLSGLAPALIVVPTIDPVADHGRRYAERLGIAGTSVRLTEYSGATHAFLSMPGVVPHAKAARAEICEFLRGAFA